MLHRPSRVNDGQPAFRRLIPPLSATVTSSILVAADTVAILGAGWLSHVLLITRAGPLAEFCVLFVWLVSMMLMHFAGLYRFEAASWPLRYVVPVAVALATAFLFLLAAGFSIKVSDTFSRLWMTSFAAGSLGFVLLGRAAVSASFSGLMGNRLLRRNLAVVGDGEQTVRLVQRLHADRSHPISICGVFVDGQTGPAAGLNPRLGGQRLGGDLDALVREARWGAIDDVVIALPWCEDERVMAIVSRLRELPVNVYLASDLIGFRTEFRSPPGHFGALPVVQLVGRPMSGWDSVIKALEDYVLASILVVASCPLLLAIAVAIKLDSRGPVLFRQKRLGFNNQVIDVYKFRSMRADSGHAAASTLQATRADPRVTRVGGVLRRWSLDELPQLFNVLNGTMSLVGPRPHALDHNEDFARQIRGYFARHRVKPGITGLAQVRGYRGATDTQEKLEGRVRNDIFYVDNWSLSFDVQILLRTFVICLVGKNAY